MPDSAANESTREATAKPDVSESQGAPVVSSHGSISPDGRRQSTLNVSFQVTSTWGEVGGSSAELGGITTEVKRGSNDSNNSEGSKNGVGVTHTNPGRSGGSDTNPTEPQKHGMGPTRKSED